MLLHACVHVRRLSTGESTAVGAPSYPGAGRRDALLGAPLSSHHHHHHHYAFTRIDSPSTRSRPGRASRWIVLRAGIDRCRSIDGDRREQPRRKSSERNLLTRALLHSRLVVRGEMISFLFFLFSFLFRRTSFRHWIVLATDATHVVSRARCDGDRYARFVRRREKISRGPIFRRRAARPGANFRSDAARFEREGLSASFELHWRYARVEVARNGAHRIHTRTYLAH